MSKKVFWTLIMIIAIELVVVILLMNEQHLESKQVVTEQMQIGKYTEKDDSVNKTETISQVTEEKEVISVETPQTPEFIPVQNPTANTYYIKVNNLMNTVTIYIQDELGMYTVPIKAMICSTGDETLRNSTYKITNKRWLWRELFGDVYGQYTTQIYGNILFHSVPYSINKNPGSLEYWEYDKLGTTCSAGCVRLKVEDAKWIYDNCPYGTTVEFYDDEDPGPLGKPSIEPITDYEEYRNWDPTDPNENNPWKELL